MYRWHFGIGDPTLIGWTTVAAYAAATWACWAAHRHSRSQAPRTSAFWLLATVLLAALGVNKQLDLQTAFTDIGRHVALAHGWYARRHGVQVAFIEGVGVVSVCALLGFGWLSWPLTVGRATVLFGLVFLAAFVLVRASSFHHVDVFLSSTALGLRWNWIIELTGIALVGAGSVVERNRMRRQPPTS